MGSGVGLIPEQAWDQPDLARSPFGTDPTIASIGFQNGKPAGSAAALTWSAGQFVRLMLDVGAGKVLDRPDYTADRYVKHTQGQTTLTVTAPADRTPVAATPWSWRARRRRATRSSSAAVNHDDHTALTRPDEGGPGRLVQRHRRADRRHDGPQRRGHEPDRRDRACAARSCSTSRPARCCSQSDDPDGDDNGPGNYAYPTSDNFKPGAYDLRAVRRSMTRATGSSSASARAT